MVFRRSGGIASEQRSRGRYRSEDEAYRRLYEVGECGARGQKSSEGGVEGSAGCAMEYGRGDVLDDVERVGYGGRWGVRCRSLTRSAWLFFGRLTFSRGDFR